MTGMPDAYTRVQAALDAQIHNPRLNDGLADAACCTVLDIARDLERENPGYRDAFQALAERLGYV